MSSSRALREMTRVRFLMFTREPEAVFWVFLFPIVLALVLSFAFKQRGVESVRVGVVQGETEPSWVSALEGGGAIKVVTYPTREEAERKLRSGALAALVTGGEPVNIRFDPTRPEGETARLRVLDAVERARGRTDPVPVTTQVLTEHGSRYIDFLIPGLLGMNLMGTGIWGTGFSIVDWRQRKLLKRFLVTPMRKSQFLLAQVLSRIGFLILEVIIIVAFGVFVLGVPFRGSLAAFALVCLIGTFCFSGLGLLIAARPRTLEGVSGVMNFVMMPMWLFSGVFFSYEKFPEIFHPAIRLLPLTALNDGLRGLMLEGTAGPHLLVQSLVLVFWGAVSFFVALRIFRWQ
jgi:ABC-2 type transport system permease protein